MKQNVYIFRDMILTGLPDGDFSRRSGGRGPPSNATGHYRNTVETY